MNKAIKNYILLQITSFFVICLLINIAYYFNLNLASDTISNHIRNDLLIRDFKSVQFNLSFSKNSGFNHVEVYDLNKQMLLSTSEPIKTIWVKKIIKKIKINPNSESFVYLIVFYYDLVKPLLYTFIGLGVFSFLTIPYVFLENKRIKKELELEKLKIKNEEIRKAALQVFHDIRSPLAALNSVINNISSEDTFELKILRKSIEQMNHMSESMLARSRGDRQRIVSEFDMVEMLKMIVNMKNISLAHDLVRLSLNCSDKVIVVAEKYELERVISNLINNAIEAKDLSEVEVLILENENSILIKIKDKGTGIPKSILQNLGKEGVTNKVSGNGLGIMHAVSKLQEMGSDLIIETSNNGTIVGFELLKNKIEVVKVNKIILVDDDELTRMIWENKAKKQKIDLTCFKDVDQFMEQVKNIEHSTTIYLDNNIGESSGLKLAEKLHSLGYKNLYMATGNQPEEFANFGFLKGVIGKEPPF